MKTTLKKILVLFTLLIPPLLASAQQFSISIGEPEYYGQITLGDDMGRPTLLYPNPVIIQSGPGVVYSPLYLRVPLIEARHWDRYCYRHNACNRPVYFVTDSWYLNTYIPRYRERWYWRDGRRYDRWDRHHHDRWDRHHDRWHGKSDYRARPDNRVPAPAQNWVRPDNRVAPAPAENRARPGNRVVPENRARPDNRRAPAPVENRARPGNRVVPENRARPDNRMAPAPADVRTRPGHEWR